MAAAPMPQPGMGAPKAMGGDAPASPEQQQLAAIYQHLKQMASGNPLLAAGLEKAAAGIQEAQSSLVSQAPPSPMQNPQY